MEPRELIYNVYKDIVSIKNSFDNENLWCNSYKTIQGLTSMTPGYIISMGYTPHIDIEEYLSEGFIEKLKLCFKKYQKDAIIWMVNHPSILYQIFPNNQQFYYQINKNIHHYGNNKRNQKLGMDQISRGPIYGIPNPIFRNCNR